MQDHSTEKIGPLASGLLGLLVGFIGTLMLVMIYTLAHCSSFAGTLVCR
jgi:hypothetical protein